MYPLSILLFWFCFGPDKAHGDSFKRSLYLVMLGLGDIHIGPTHYRRVIGTHGIRACTSEVQLIN